MKELLKKIYLFDFKIRYYVGNIFRRQKNNEVLFVQEFSHTLDSIDQNLSNVIYTKTFINPKIDSKKKQIKALKRAKYVYCDNYYVGLCAVGLSNKVVTQVWHAGIAIKKIGFDSEEIKKTKKSKKKRYQKVYDSFDYYICASEHMAEVFIHSFNQDKSKMIVLGHPKYDFFFKSKYLEQVEEIKKKNEDNILKFNILYAPTFRKNREDNWEQINILKNLAKYNESYNIFYKLHPIVKDDKKLVGKLNKLNDVIELNDNELDYYMSIADIVITDYSAVSLEAVILDKILIHYNYDYDKYKAQRGFNIEEEKFPGIVTHKFSEIEEILKSNSFPKKSLEQLDQKLQPKSLNKSSRKIIKRIMNNENINLGSKL